MHLSGLACQQLGFARPGRKPVLEMLQARFAPGQATLISAPTGTGKSTLLHLLGGLLRPTSGEVWADGQPVSRWPAPHRDRWRRQVGMVFQHLNLVPDLSVMENVLLPCIPTASSYTALIQRAGSLLKQLDLPSADREPLQTLSGGERQRVAIVRALITRPRFLLMDEPTSFQDDDGTANLLILLAEAAADDACVVVCSHDVRLRDETRIFGQKLRLHSSRLEPDP
jgi:ABC-type lipoprotein export system ATPase subunit